MLPFRRRHRHFRRFISLAFISMPRLCAAFRHLPIFAFITRDSYHAAYCRRYCHAISRRHFRFSFITLRHFRQILRHATAAFHFSPLLPRCRHFLSPILFSPLSPIVFDDAAISCRWRFAITPFSDANDFRHCQLLRFRRRHDAAISLSIFMLILFFASFHFSLRRRFHDFRRFRHFSFRCHFAIPCRTPDTPFIISFC